MSAFIDTPNATGSPVVAYRFSARPIWRLIVTYLLIGPLNPVGVFWWRESLSGPFGPAWEMFLIWPGIAGAAFILMLRLSVLATMRRRDYIAEIIVLTIAASAAALGPRFAVEGYAAISAGKSFNVLAYFAEYMAFVFVIVLSAGIPAALWSGLTMRWLFARRTSPPPERRFYYTALFSTGRGFLRQLGGFLVCDLQAHFERPSRVLLAWLLAGPLNLSIFAWKFIPSPLADTFGEAFFWIGTPSAVGSAFAFLVLKRTRNTNTGAVFGVFLMVSFLTVAVFPILFTFLSLSVRPEMFIENPGLILGMPMMMYLFAYMIPFGPILAIFVQIPAVCAAFIVVRFLLYRPAEKTSA